MKIQHLWTLIGALLLVILQAGVFNYINLFRYATPSVYLFALMLFSINTSRAAMTLWGALIGLLLDILSGTPGLHMAAMTLVGFLRNYLLLAVVESDSDHSRLPSVRNHGRGVILSIVELVVIHQLVLFSLDSLRGFDVSYYLLRMGSSMLLTLLMVMLLQIVCLEQTFKHKQ